jgi:fructose-bisphosphate aldolase, class II
MTAVPLSDLLRPAMDGGYALAGLVVLGWEDAVAFVEAAEETGIPIVLQAGPGCRRHTPIPVIGKMLRHLADQASVPIACHIDHATTLEECAAGIEHGFTSVMIDGSALPLDENIRLTADVVALAHHAGVSVEGEVGTVGYAAGVASTATLPEEAARFAAATGVDALAVSVGNVHLQTDKTDGIDFAALAAIEAVTSLPLVLHGGSGIPDAVRQRLARATRVAKFNIGTELRMVFGQALRRSIIEQPEVFDRITLLKPTIAPMRAATIQLIRALRYRAG